MSAEVTHVPATDQERAIWKYIHQTRQFTNKDIAAVTVGSEWRRQNYLRKLRQMGILQVCGRQGSELVLTVLDPKAAQDFSARKRKSKEGMMWSSVRSMVSFTQDDILAILGTDDIGITAKDVRKYCSVLLQGGYLAVLQKGRLTDRPARYRLVRDTGPLPPLLRKMQVIVDSNEERAVHVMGVRI